MAQICLKVGQWFLLNAMPMTILHSENDRYILGANNGQRHFYTRTELENLFSLGKISGELSANSNKENIIKVKKIEKGLNLSEEGWEKIKYKRLLIQELMHLPWNKVTIDCSIKQFYEKNPKCKLAKPSFVTAWRWVKKYKQQDSDISALLDKPGKGKWNRFPPGTIEICKETIDEIYMSRTKGTITQTLVIAKARVQQKSSSLPVCEIELKIPTRRLIERLVSEIPAYEREVAREGPDLARNRHRGVSGQRKEINFREIGELDATPVNVVLLDDYTHAILGRGWVTLHKEITSQYPLGVYIGYTPPSCLTLAECMKHSLLPKHNLKDEFPNIENEWLGYGPVERIKVDNAFENHSKTIDSIVSMLNTDVIYCGRATPWQKPNIESYLGYVATDCFHKIPGTTFNNIFEKGDYDSEEYAVMTFSQFRAHIMKWLVDVYMQKPQRSLNNLSPATMWKHLSESQGPIFETRALNLDLILGRVYERQVNNKGIAWEGLLYTSQDLINLRMKFGRKFKTTIRINELDISYLWVKIPNSSDEYIKVPAINQKYTRNLSSYLHGINRSWAKKHQYKDDEQGWMQASADIYELVRGIPQKKNKVSAKKAARILTQLDPKKLSEPAPLVVTNEIPDEPPTKPSVLFDIGTEDEIEDFEIIIKEK